MINKDTEFKISSEIVVSEINNDSVILDLNSGVYFQTNELGSFIITELENYTTLAILQEKILLSFNVSIETCKNDLENFVEILFKKNLVLMR